MIVTKTEIKNCLIFRGKLSKKQLEVLEQIQIELESANRWNGYIQYLDPRQEADRNFINNYLFSGHSQNRMVAWCDGEYGQTFAELSADAWENNSILYLPNGWECDGPCANILHVILGWICNLFIFKNRSEQDRILNGETVSWRSALLKRLSAKGF